MSIITRQATCAQWRNSAPGPHCSGDIAQQFGRTVTALAPTRSQLIAKVRSQMITFPLLQQEVKEKSTISRHARVNRLPTNPAMPKVELTRMQNLRQYLQRLR